jgi:hypothetical protein
MVFLTRPRPGCEDEYNRWYDHVHVPDVLKVPGFRSAQRFRLQSEIVGGIHPYLAIYEIETDDLEQVKREMVRRIKSGEMAMSDAVDWPGNVAGYYEPLEITSAGRPTYRDEQD